MNSKKNMIVLPVLRFSDGFLLSGRVVLGKFLVRTFLAAHRWFYESINRLLRESASHIAANGFKRRNVGSASAENSSTNAWNANTNNANVNANNKWNTNYVRGSFAKEFVTLLMMKNMSRSNHAYSRL